MSINGSRCRSITFSSSTGPINADLMHDGVCYVRANIHCLVDAHISTRVTKKGTDYRVEASVALSGTKPLLAQLQLQI